MSGEMCPICKSWKNECDCANRDAAYDLVLAAKDALESLKRLPDVDGAYRVTCIQQLQKALRKAGALK